LVFILSLITVKIVSYFASKVNPFFQKSSINLSILSRSISALSLASANALVKNVFPFSASIQSRFYSHSWHWNQSRSFQFAASSWLIRSSSPHPQQDTNTSLVITWPLSIGFTISLLFILFISLLFLSLTGNSIAGSPKIASFILTFLVLSQNGDLSRLRPLRSGLHCVSLGRRSIPAMSFPKWVGILVLLARLFLLCSFSCCSFSHSLKIVYQKILRIASTFFTLFHFFFWVNWQDPCQVRPFNRGVGCNPTPFLKV